MNGAEIIIRPTLIEPAVKNGMWELQNRAHAMFNSAYVVAPNLGPEIREDGGMQDLFGGQSMIVDPRGQILAQQRGWTSGDSFVCTTIDIEALRRRGSRTASTTSSRICGPSSTGRSTTSRSTRRTSTSTLRRRGLAGARGRDAGEEHRDAIERGVLTPPSDYKKSISDNEPISDTAEKIGV